MKVLFIAPLIVVVLLVKRMCARAGTIHLLPVPVAPQTQRTQLFHMEVHM